MKLPSMGDLHKISKLLTPERVEVLKNAVTDVRDLQDKTFAYLDAHDARVEAGDPDWGSGASPGHLEDLHALRAAETVALAALREAARKVRAGLAAAEEHGFSQAETGDLLS